MPYKGIGINLEDIELGGLMGTYIRLQREEENMSVTFLADAIQMNKGYLSQIEHGRKMPAENMKRRIFNVIDVDFNEDVTIRSTLRKKVSMYYVNYVEKNDDKNEELFCEVMDNKDVYENSYAYLQFYMFIYMNNIQKGLFNAEVVKYEKILNLYQSLLNMEERCIFLEFKAMKFIKKKDYRSAQSILESLLKIASPSNKGMILYYLTIVYQHNNLLPKAIMACEEALLMFNQNYNFKRSLYLSMLKGNCFARSRLYNDAEKIYLKTINKANSLNYQDIISTLYDNLAWNAILAKGYEKVINYTVLAKQHGSNFKEINIYIPFALFKLNRFEACKNEIENALHELESNNDNRLYLFALKEYIDGNYDAFLSYLSKYHKFIEGRGDDGVVLFVLYIYLEYYESRNDFDQLYYYQKKILDLLT